MLVEQRLLNYPRHPSMRGEFAYQLYLQMAKNKDIYVLTGDLGYGLFNSIKDDFPERYINCGAGEDGMMGIAIGLALSGKVPVVYSITSFLLYRAYEQIRLYVDHESVPVILVGGCRATEYEHDGYSHHAEDAKAVLDIWKNITQYWPSTKEELELIVPTVIEKKKPAALILSRY